MKKILCLTDGFTLGGAERQLIGLAHLLKERGYIVDLACYHNKNFYTKLISQYNLNCITLTPNGRLGKITVVKSLITENNYDYVIAYKNGATIIVSILKLLGLKAKVIVSERNTTQVLSFRERLKFGLYRFADYIVPNSFSQEKFLLNHYPAYRDKVITITNFTDISTFCPALYYKKSEKIEIIIAGRIAEQKNILRFLSVLRKIKEQSLSLHFKWFGNVSAGEGEYQKKVLHTLHKYAIEDIIEFLPATKDIKKEYQQCDAFCLPSLYEGYPNVVCEAMSCAKPILCSNVCDNPFIVQEGRNGFMFDPTNEDSMFFAFLKFSKLSIKERIAMGDVSRGIAVDKFSEKAFVDKYIQLIEKV